MCSSRLLLVATYGFATARADETPTATKSESSASASAANSAPSASASGSIERRLADLQAQIDALKDAQANSTDSKDDVIKIYGFMTMGVQRLFLKQSSLAAMFSAGANAMDL